MDLQNERPLLGARLEAFEPAFDLPRDRRLVYEQSRTTADRTRVRQRLHDRLPDTLPGDLHETEFRERQDRTFRAVVAKLFLHLVIDFLAVALVGHVDKVDHDNTAD